MEEILNLSQVLTLLDRFDCETLSWDLSVGNEYERRLWDISSDKFVKFMSDKDVVVADLKNMIFIKSTRGVLDSIKKSIEKILEDYEYDYKSVVDVLYRAAFDKVCKLCKFIPNEYEKVYITEIVPFNEEWSYSIDISFQAGGDHGREIAFPNANKFGLRHIQEWNKLSPHPGRIKRDYYHRCFTAICHEIFHCIQIKLGQIDTDPLSWSAEHDASYLAGSMLHHLFQSDLKNSHPGLFEEIMILWIDDVKHQKANLFEEVNESYDIWVDSFGLKAPSQNLVKSGVPTYFKNRIAIEALQTDESEFVKQLDDCFKDRTGDVYLKMMKGRAVVRKLV